MDFDRRVLLSACVWITRWFHCLQLVAEKRHTIDGDDLRVCKPGGSGVSGLANRRRTTDKSNIDRRSDHHQLGDPDHDLRTRTRSGNPRLPMSNSTMRVKSV